MVISSYFIEHSTLIIIKLNTKYPYKTPEIFDLNDRDIKSISVSSYFFKYLYNGKKIM